MYNGKGVHPISYADRRITYSSKGYPRTGKYDRFVPAYRKIGGRRWEKLQPVLDCMNGDISMVPNKSQEALAKLDGIIKMFEGGCRKHLYGQFYDYDHGCIKKPSMASTS